MRAFVSRWLTVAVGLLALVMAFFSGAQFRPVDQEAIMRNRAISADTNLTVKSIHEMQLRVLAYIAAANNRGIENAPRIKEFGARCGK